MATQRTHYNSRQVVYEDAAVADAVSSLLNLIVDYTEQGMQDQGLVRMEH